MTLRGTRMHLHILEMTIFANCLGDRPCPSLIKKKDDFYKSSKNFKYEKILIAICQILKSFHQYIFLKILQNYNIYF